MSSRADFDWAGGIVIGVGGTGKGPVADPAKVAGLWSARGFSFGGFTDPPGQVWKDSVHDTDEVPMADQGGMELRMQGRTIRGAIREAILIPAAGVVHTVRNVGKTGSQWNYGYKSVPGEARLP